MIKAILLLLFTLFRKVFGLFYYPLVVPFRAYARSVIYNYVLENGVYLKRLLERPIVKTASGYTIKPYHGTQGGFIKYRKVSKIEYYLVFSFIWGWLDDDSNYDTTDKGYIETLVNRERMTWLPEFVIDKLEDDLNYMNEFGNAFDLGDAQEPLYRPLSALFWNVRNTAYNFSYMMNNSPKQDFYYKIGEWEFGWKPDMPLNGESSYSIVFGRNF